MQNNRNLLLGGGVLVAVIIVAVLAFVLLGGDDDDDGGDTGGSALTLGESVSASNPDIGTLTVSYPDGYAAAADDAAGSIMIANSQEVLDAMEVSESPTDSEIEAGQFGMIAIGFPAEFASFFGIEDGAGMGDALTAMITGVIGSEGDVTFDVGDPEEATFGANSGAIVSGTATEDGVTNDGTFVLLDTGGGYVLLMGIAAEGEGGGYNAAVRAIAASVQYEAPAGEEAEG